MRNRSECASEAARWKDVKRIFRSTKLIRYLFINPAVVADLLTRALDARRGGEAAPASGVRPSEYAVPPFSSMMLSHEAVRGNVNRKRSAIEAVRDRGLHLVQPEPRVSNTFSGETPHPRSETHAAHRLT